MSQSGEQVNPAEQGEMDSEGHYYIVIRGLPEQGEAEGEILEVAQVFSTESQYERKLHALFAKLARENAAASISVEGPNGELNFFREQLADGNWTEWRSSSSLTDPVAQEILKKLTEGARQGHRRSPDRYFKD